MSHEIPANVAYVAVDARDTPVPTRPEGDATRHAATEALAQVERVYLMAMPDQAPLVLSGSAALIWLLAAAGQPDVAGAVAAATAAPEEVVAPDVRAYLDDLVGRGLLRRGPDRE